MTIRLPAPAFVDDAVRAAFGLASVGEVLRPRGADAENWTALTFDGRAVVVRCDAKVGRPLDSVASWCAQLARAGVPVVTARRTLDGAWVHPSANGDWTCWDHLEGGSPTPCPDAARSAGRLLARVHAVDVTDAQRPAPTLWRWIELLAAVHPDDAALLDALIAPARLCHVDLHFANLINTPGGLAAIDFADAGFCDPRFDVAVCAVFWGVHAGASGADSFLEGYAEATTCAVGVDLVAAAARLLALRCAGSDFADELVAFHAALLER